MIDLDAFLEEDIPTYLDSYVNGTKSLAGEDEIKGLLSTDNTQIAAADDFDALLQQHHQQVDNPTSISIQAQNVILNQTKDELVTLQPRVGAVVDSDDIRQLDADLKGLEEKELPYISSSQPDSYDEPLWQIDEEQKYDLPSLNQGELPIAELVAKAHAARTRKESRCLYLEALHALSARKKREAVSLLLGLTQVHPANVAYRTRLYDALRLPGAMRVRLPSPVLKAKTVVNDVSIYESTESDIL